MAPGVKGRGIYIPLPSSSMRSSPIPLPLRPRHSTRHTEDAAATPPNVSCRHRLTRVRGPHATPRADNLVAPAAARPSPMRGPHRRVDTARRRGRQRARLPLLHSRRTYVLRRQQFSATIVCACLVVRKFVHDLAILNNVVAALMLLICTCMCVIWWFSKCEYIMQWNTDIRN